MKSNKAIFALFIISTIFFTAEHALFWSWDFAVYLMNAQHFFSNGFFLELARPPLASLFLGLLHYGAGWKLAEFAYIILVSGLFCFSAIKLADALKIDRTLFYALEMSPFVLALGTFAGTELLSLALIQLGLAYLAKPQAGMAFSLAGLARYTDFIYAPLLLLKKKNIIQRILLFAIPVAVWLAINYLLYGSPWASIADSFAMNMKFREQQFNTILSDFMIAISWYIPFLIWGIKNSKKENWKNAMLVAIFTLLAIISYLKIPHKEARYLFNLAMPVAYFSAISLKKFINRKILCAIVVVNIIFAVILLFFFSFSPISELNAAQKAAGEINCACASNAWVDLNAIGMPCEPLPRPEAFDKYINEGYNLVIFKQADFPDYVYNYNLILKDTSYYLILGNSSVCKEQLQQMNKTYVEGLREKGIEISYCEALFGRLC